MVQDGKQMSIAALIVAAGRGTRAGGTDPKQWQMLAGKRVIDHTLNAFKEHRNIDTILVVLHPGSPEPRQGSFHPHLGPEYWHPECVHSYG